MFLFKCKKSYSAAAAKVGNMVGYFFENQCSWFCCSFFWKKREPISTAKPVTATVNKSRFVENIFARGCGCGRGRGCLVWGLPSLSTSLALLLNQREKQKHDRFVHIANRGLMRTTIFKAKGNKFFVFLFTWMILQGEEEDHCRYSRGHTFRGVLHIYYM